MNHTKQCTGTTLEPRKNVAENIFQRKSPIRIDGFQSTHVLLHRRFQYILLTEDPFSISVVQLAVP